MSAPTKDEQIYSEQAKQRSLSGLKLGIEYYKDQIKKLGYFNSTVFDSAIINYNNLIQISKNEIEERNQ